MPGPQDARAAFPAAARARAPEVTALTRGLMAVPSPNPPGEVRACAEAAAAIVRLTQAAAEEVLGGLVAVNMRVGGSDARWFRMAGLPAVVYGPAPRNMGGADEWAEIAELEAVARVHALAAFDFLGA